MVNTKVALNSQRKNTGAANNLIRTAFIIGIIFISGLNGIFGNTNLFSDSLFFTGKDSNAIIDFSREIADTEKMIEYLMKEYNVPGLSIVMIKANKIVYNRNFGVADIRDGSPVTDSTIFEACSMSKPVFSYLAMKEIETGKLKLDKPVWAVFDDPAFMGQESRKKITPRMLLTHSSGLPNWREGEDEENGYLPVEFEPGSRYSYSGEGMYYLQKVVEKLRGESLDSFSRKNLFEPFGMKHSGFIHIPEIENNLAAGHDTSGNFLLKTSYSRANAGYTLYCSALDYAGFLIEMMDRSSSTEFTLAPAWKDSMLTRQIAAESREPVERPGNFSGIRVFRGLGWVIDSTKFGDIFYHSGANSSGFRCYSQFNQKAGTGLVIMMNGMGGTQLWPELIRKTGKL